MPEPALLPNLPSDYVPMTDAVLDRGWVTRRTGDRSEITGAVNKEEAHTLASIILNNNCKRCYETGVAYGLSTLASRYFWRQS